MDLQSEEDQVLCVEQFSPGDLLAFSDGHTGIFRGANKTISGENKGAYTVFWEEWSPFEVCRVEEKYRLCTSEGVAIDEDGEEAAEDWQILCRFSTKEGIPSRGLDWNLAIKTGDPLIIDIKGVRYSCFCMGVSKCGNLIDASVFIPTFKREPVFFIRPENKLVAWYPAQKLSYEERCNMLKEREREYLATAGMLKDRIEEMRLGLEGFKK